jgi:3,4-dihydroxy 2-butanone 4-phosphate synthase
MTTQMDLLTTLGQKFLSPNLTRAVEALRDGKPVLLLDPHDRENEGDLIIAAEKITPFYMNFLIKKGSGVVCLALPKERLDHLDLPLMVKNNTNFFHTAFTISIEASSGVTTGVSAQDRTHTIKVAMNDESTSKDLARPGHVFPLAASKNGVFNRMGHTEGSVDLMRIANLKPGAVLCELMNEDGSMTRGDDRIHFAEKFDIPVISIEEILHHRTLTQDIFSKTKKNIITRFGNLTWHSFNFLDLMIVDVFHHTDLEEKVGSLKKLSLVNGDNLDNRFMAQIMNQTDDDPLAVSLSKLRDKKVDLLFLTIGKQDFAKKPQAEQKILTHAFICRTLRELLVQEISLDSFDSQFASIALNNFFIKMKDSDF